MSDNKVLSKSDILESDDLEREFVPMPEWSNGTEGAGVYVRMMTGTERDAYESSIVRFKQQGKTMSREMVMENLRAKLLSKCIVDAENNRLFTDADVSALGAKGAKPLDRLFDVAQKLNGISDEDVEELAGNLERGPSDTSTSSSAKLSGSRTPVTSYEG